MNLLSIDPGYSARGQGCACAAFRDGSLVHQFFERPERCVPGGRVLDGLEVVLWEKPQGDGRTWHVPPATMIELTAAGATLAGLYAGATGARIVAQTPQEWKGSVQKPITHARLWDVLTSDERTVLGGVDTGLAIKKAVERGALDRWRPGKSYYPSTWLVHNILDAAAMGAKYLGRLR